jgi:hypothetical protein
MVRKGREGSFWLLAERNNTQHTEVGVLARTDAKFGRARVISVWLAGARKISRLGEIEALIAGIVGASGVLQAAVASNGSVGERQRRAG